MERDGVCRGKLKDPGYVCVFTLQDDEDRQLPPHDHLYFTPACTHTYVTI